MDNKTKNIQVVIETQEKGTWAKLKDHEADAIHHIP